MVDKTGQVITGSVCKIRNISDRRMVLCGRTEGGTVMRLIDADALKKDLIRFYDGEVVARKLIDEQQTIDAVPVVRCKDCKLYQPDADKLCGYFECMGFEPDDYCSQGERKDGNDD